MAASQRSPSMRDQWRAEDEYRPDNNPRAKDRRVRRHRSPAAGPDLGVKIKGRATTDPASRSPSRTRISKPGRVSTEVDRRESALSHQRPSKREGPSKRSRGLSEERHPDRPQHRNSSKSSKRRRRSPARLAYRESFDYRDDRRTSRSPEYPGRADRAVGLGSRRRTRKFSPHRSPRDNHYSSYDDIPESIDRSIRDSYVPSKRRHRSRSPLSREKRYPSPNRRRSPSIDRRSRKTSPPPRKKSLPRGSRRSREPESPYARLPRSRQTSPDRYQATDRRRRESNTPPRIQSRQVRRSRSPRNTGRAREGRKMQSFTRPIQSVLDDSTRPPSPPRPIPSFDSESHNPGDMREAFPLHGMKASDIHGAHRPGPPQLETRHSYSTSPQYMTPTSSHHGSPQSGSPYSRGRGGWGGQQQQFHSQPVPNVNSYSPPFRQNSYPPQNGPQGQYYPNNQHGQFTGPPQQIPPNFQTQSFRGGHSNYRGSNFNQAHDRRFSSSGPPNYGIHAPRGRGGHFQNLQWTASGGSRGRGQGNQSQNNLHPSGQSQSPPQRQQQQSGTQSDAASDDDDNPFRPSKDLQVEDQNGNDNNDMQNGPSPDGKKMPPPSRQNTGATQAKEASKFSFAFKAKAAPPQAAKPVPDLALKMKESTRKDTVFDSSKTKVAPHSSSRDEVLPRTRTEHRGDSRLDRTDDRRDREYRDEYRTRDDRQSDREFRDQRRGEHRIERRTERDRERERERERSPEPRMEKKIMKRLKPKLTLPTEFAASTSVYFRKPGNESVVGSGTYGKVFKAIHVYTKSLVALKKIRMEGEKDGFPVTAVREIKLLQSLKHDNVVSLQEVMVEKNDCFMVFEYLSHDLTGLLNHPTFKLEDAHKKHLAKQLFEGLNYLHRRGVLHRDIKAANILVSSTGQLKLADFGLARFFAKRRQLDYTNRVITIWYRPPELLLGETQYGPAVDIWSAACVMVEIFVRHAIFPGDGREINQLDKIYNVLGTPTRSEWPGLVDLAWFELLRPAERKPNTFAEKFRDRLTPAAFDLLQAMFLYDPVKRPTAGDVLEHPYFTTEEPAPRQAVELKDLQGDWHEFESKALRKENERKAQDAKLAKRVSRQEEHQREKEKRRASVSANTERDSKRLRPSSSHSAVEET